MTELGVYLTAVGMGGVFLVLTILASLMWLLGRILSPTSATRDEVAETFSREEIMAIAAAIVQHESVRLPEVKTPEDWKKFARSYAVGWSG